MVRKMKFAAIASATLLVAACGGGSGGGEGAVNGANVSVEGAWQGTSSNNYVVNIIALENNEFYTIFGVMNGSNLLVYGFDQGTVTVSGSSLSGSFREYPNGVASYAGTLAATAVAATSITGTTTYSSGSSTFAVTPIPTTIFNYSGAASISDVVGSWTGSLSSGSAGTVTISNTGMISGTSAGCLFSGTATPRSSGKNVFNVSVTFGAAPCALAGQTATGIAVNYAISGTAQKQLIVAVQDSSKQFGAMWHSPKPIDTFHSAV
jgi:hypothetical protein